MEPTYLYLTAANDGFAAHYRGIARAAGFDAVPDASPWAEGAGIVHIPTFRGEERVNDTVYTSWEFCCWENGLCRHAQPRG